MILPPSSLSLAKWPSQLLSRLALVGVPGLLLSLATIGLAPSANAADLYVSPKGSDTNPGTNAERPLKTLQKANSLVKPGNTVWIMQGIYRNSATDVGGGTSSLLDITTSGTPNAPITWRNYKNDRPELIAQGCWNAIALHASYIVIDGLILTGNNDNVRQRDAEINAEIDAVKTAEAFAAAQGKGKTIDESVAPNAKLSAKEIAKSVPAPRPKPVQAHPPSPIYCGNGICADFRNSAEKHHHYTIRNCTVRKFGTVGIAMIATDYYNIENCDVYENAWYSRYGGSGISQLGGINFDNKPGYHNIIRNNRVWNNKCLVRCLNTDCFSDGNGIILDSLVNYSGDVLVQNNLSFNNGGAGIHVFKSNKAHIDVVGNTLWRNQQMWQLYDLGCHSASNVRFLNNIVYAERVKQVNGKPLPTVSYDYNIYYGSENIPSKGEHDLYIDPKFVMASTNPDVANFHLQPDSPARGAALKADYLPTITDLDGKPVGDKPNLGAYQ